MNDRIAYLIRTDRGAMITGARLIGPHGEDRFTAAAVGDDAVARAADAASAAGRWLAEQLKAKRAKTLTALCLDADGGVCSWVASPSREAGIVESVARQLPEHEGAAPQNSAPLNYFAESPSAAQLQGLCAQQPARRAGLGRRKPAVTDQSERVPVLALADVSARLVADELDKAGISIDSATSIWHLMAMAWDRPSTAPGTGEVINPDQCPMSAVVLVEPEGRLVWCWSRGGLLVAGGSLRLATPRVTPTGEAEAPHVEPRVAIAESDLSRLCVEWLSWSVQLGHGPRRTICVVPPEAAVVHTLDGPAALGERLVQRWPETAVDVAVHEDPIGATLGRTLSLERDHAEDAEDPRRALRALAHRPGSAHRRLFRWSATAIAIAAVALAAAAWRVDGMATLARASAEQWELNTRELVEKVHKPATFAPGGPIMALRSELARLQSQVAPAEVGDPIQPIMDEVEALSLVIGFSDFDLTELAVDNRSVRIIGVAPDLQTAEALSEAVQSINGSNVQDWLPPQFQPMPASAGQPGKVRITLVGQWAPITKTPGTARGKAPSGPLETAPVASGPGVNGRLVPVSGPGGPA